MTTVHIRILGGFLGIALSASAIGQDAEGVRLSASSPASSNGLILERLVITKSEDPVVTIDGDQWSGFTNKNSGDVALFIRIPEHWKKSVKPDEYGNADGLTITAKTSTGFKWTMDSEFAMRPSDYEYSEDILFLEIPRGWPDYTESIRITVVSPNREFGTWRFEGFEPTKVIFGPELETIETQTIDGVRFKGYAFTGGHARWGEQVVSGVVALDDPPNGETWTLHMEQYQPDREVSGWWGAGGSSTAVKATDEAIAGGNPFFTPYASTIKRMGMLASIDKLVTEKERFSAPTFKLEPGESERAKELGVYHFVVEKQLTFELPSGIVVTIPKQDGATERKYPVWSGNNAYLIFKMNVPRYGARPARSTLVEKYGKPVKLSVSAKNSMGLAQYEEDDYFILTFSYSGIEVPSEAKLTFEILHELVLESKIMFFLVPVEDRTESGKREKS